MIRLAVAALLAAGPAAAVPATDAQIAEFAAPEPQLRDFLTRVVFTTEAAGMGTYAIGLDGACKIIVPAFEASVARHLPAWRGNLVRAYRTSVPPAVLDKAIASGPVTGAAALLPYAGAVGATMQKVSAPILTEAATEVLKPLLAAMNTVDVAAVDGAARGRELSAALDAGTAQCGLPDSAKRPA